MKPSTPQPETGIVCLLALLVGFMAFPSDPDVWFHLADGKWILAYDAVPQTDPFSFTRAGGLWVPHSWLFDVFSYTIWTTYSPRALEACMACLYLLAIASGFALLRHCRVSSMQALLLCAVVAIFAGNTRGVRPQVCSLLLTVHLLYLLVSQRDRLRPLAGIWIAGLFLLWAQLHAACVMGLVLMTAWTCGRSIETWQKRESWRGLLTLWATLLASGLMILITPHAMTHYEYALYTLRLTYLKTMVAEWQPPHLWPLASPDIFFFLGLTGCFALGWQRRKRIALPELFVAGLTWMLAATATRHIPLATVASLPLLGSLLRGSAEGEEAPLPAGPTAIGIGGLLGCCVILLLWRLPEPIAERHQRVEPVHGTAALLAHAPLRVFTNYNTGAYVLHAAPGALLVSADSRADVYGDALLRAVDIALNTAHWNEMFTTWGVDAAVIDRNDPLAKRLQQDPEWVLLGEDVEELTFLRSALLPPSGG